MASSSLLAIDDDFVGGGGGGRGGGGGGGRRQPPPPPPPPQQSAVQRLRSRQNKLFRRIEGDIKEREKKRKRNNGIKCHSPQTKLIDVSALRLRYIARFHTGPSLSFGKCNFLLNTLPFSIPSSCMFSHGVRRHFSPKKCLFRRLFHSVGGGGGQESYVDRDRLIAVSLGESDIRETMIKHREFLVSAERQSNSNQHYIMWVP